MPHEIQTFSEGVQSQGCQSPGKRTAPACHMEKTTRYKRFRYQWPVVWSLCSQNLQDIFLVLPVPHLGAHVQPSIFSGNLSAYTQRQSQLSHSSSLVELIKCESYSDVKNGPSAQNLKKLYKCLRSNPSLLCSMSILWGAPSKKGKTNVVIISIPLTLWTRAPLF